MADIIGLARLRRDTLRSELSKLNEFITMAEWLARAEQLRKGGGTVARKPVAVSGRGAPARGDAPLAAHEGVAHLERVEARDVSERLFGGMGEDTFHFDEAEQAPVLVPLRDKAV